LSEYKDQKTLAAMMQGRHSLEQSGIFASGSDFTKEQSLRPQIRKSVGGLSAAQPQRHPSIKKKRIIDQRATSSSKARENDIEQLR
jgi:hypothetical protein